MLAQRWLLAAVLRKLRFKKLKEFSSFAHRSRPSAVIDIERYLRQSKEMIQNLTAAAQSEPTRGLGEMISRLAALPPPASRAEVGNQGRSGDDCGQIWIDGDLLFGALAIAGALAAYFLYTTITQKGRRRKKREDTLRDRIFENLAYAVVGNSHFEVALESFAAF